MDVVIPIKAEAPRNYLELRYALRSIESCFEHLGDGECFLLGPKAPDWYQGGFFEIDEPKKLSQVSAVISKLHDFIDSFTPHSFAYSNDDIYLMRKWDGTRYYNKREGHGYGYHAVTVERAKFLLGQRGLAFVHDYELHVPIILETKKVQTLLDGLDYSAPIAFRSMYCNTFFEDSVGIPDCKVMNFMKPDMKWRFFSSDDQFVSRPDFHKWMQASWPRPSRWEK